MASMTITDIPEHILGRLAKKAAEDRRSPEQELVHILEQALPRDTDGSDAEARAQYEAWSRLGVWESDLSSDEEIRDIYSHRTLGRSVEL